jgi:hypothetical protein
MEAIGSFESALVTRATRRHLPDDATLYELNSSLISDDPFLKKLKGV